MLIAYTARRKLVDRRVLYRCSCARNAEVHFRPQSLKSNAESGLSLKPSLGSAPFDRDLDVWAPDPTG